MKCLVVDDEKDLREILKTTLESAGYSVDVASNGKEALKIATHSPPDIVISDVLMPEMDGFMLCRKLKEDASLHNIPVIFYTANYLEPEDEKLALALGVSMYFRKPMESSQLLQAIEKTISEHQGHKLPVSTTPIGDADKLTQIHEDVLLQQLSKQVKALEKEIAERTQAEIALEHSSRALKTLSACNRVLIHAEDETQLLCDICQAIIEEGGYRLAWVGCAEHDKTKHVRPIAEAGFDEGYLESLNITWDDKKRGRGPAGTAIRNREPSIAQNIQDDPRFSPWREAALKHGYRSCVALPIIVDDEVFGALNVYAPEPYAFNEDEVNLLTELTDDLAFGIFKLRMRARRLQAEETLQKSERQYHEIINTALDAFVCMDADGIITDWNPQAETIFGWRRAEMLGQPVSDTIIPPEYRKKHKQGLKHYLATGEGPILNHLIEINAQHHDGHTFPVELSIVPMQTNGTKRFNAFIHDISARQKAKKALKASLVGTIVAISKAVEARDPYTAGHQQRVARLARCIAQEMDMDSDRIDGLRMGATIHDIGKIHLPAEILSKPSKLTEMEFELIKTHCQVGYDILKDIEFPWPVANIAYQHHERLDGTGYPQGLKGEEICLEARIVAVADVVEAMASHRPYRPTLGIDAALEEITVHRGEWFEPAAVDACLKLIREKEFSFDDNRSR